MSTTGNEMTDEGEGETPGVSDPFRQFLSFRRDVLVLSVAMFAFSLGFQMTTRYIPKYMEVLGANALAIGLFGTVQNIIGAVYPYPGGVVSDRLGSRRSLTLFGLVSGLGFLVWLLAPTLGAVTGVAPWLWLFVGLLLAQAWKSLGLGATFAIVSQSVQPSRLARGFASTEVFRRTAFLFGPLIAAGVLFVAAEFVIGFRALLAVAVLFGFAATAVQYRYYRPEDTSIGDSFAGLGEVLADLRGLPPELRPLLVADTLVRFANGMVYVFFIIVVTDFLSVGLDLGVVVLEPAVFFGLLLAIEMVVALVSMPVAARLAESVGLKPVVALGFSVYAVFPALLVFSPANPAVVMALFALSGLRFAGLPAHKALIVGPAERDTGGRVAGSYYLVRNTVVIPSAALGGALYGGFTVPATDLSVSGSPEVAFSLATGIGLLGTALFLRYGREFGPYG